MSLFQGSIPREDIRSILDTATVLVEECRVFLEGSTVKIRGTDVGGVALVIINIDKEAFNNAEIGDGDVCWDFSEMTEMIKTADSEADIDLKIQDSNLLIDFLDLHFSLSLIDPDSLKRDQEKPDIDLDAEIVLDSSVLKRGIDAADLVGDHVEFGIDEEKSAFYMKAKGESNEVILKREKQDLVTLTATSVSSTYSVEYLKDICKAIPEDTDVGIHLGDDLPAEISYTVVDGNVTVTYFIAPRLEPDS